MINKYTNNDRFYDMLINHFIHQFEGKQKDCEPRKRIKIRKRSERRRGCYIIFQYFCFNQLSETYSAVEGIVEFSFFDKYT